MDYLKYRVQELEKSVKYDSKKFKTKSKTKSKSKSKSKIRRKKSNVKFGNSTKKGFRKLKYDEHILKPKYRAYREQSIPTSETLTSKNFYNLKSPPLLTRYKMDLENERDESNIVEKFKFAVGKVDEKITKIKRVLTESSSN